MIFPNQMHYINQIKTKDFFFNLNRIQNYKCPCFVELTNNLLVWQNCTKSDENAVGRDISASIHKN